MFELGEAVDMLNRPHVSLSNRAPTMLFPLRPGDVQLIEKQDMAPSAKPSCQATAEEDGGSRSREGDHAK